MLAGLLMMRIAESEVNSILVIVKNIKVRDLGSVSPTIHIFINW